MTLGSRLKQARNRKGLNQQEVADKLGITNGAISGYERNYRDPDTETLQRLAKLYDVSVDWLLGSEKKKESVFSLPENEFDNFIREREEKYGVSLRDDPVVMASLRQLVESIAQAKLSQQKPHNRE